MDMFFIKLWITIFIRCHVKIATIINKIVIKIIATIEGFQIFVKNKVSNNTNKEIGIINKTIVYCFFYS